MVRRVDGRFNRLDPFFGNSNDPQSFHKYLYTHADPVNGIDPSGLFGVVNTIGAIDIALNLNSLAINVSDVTIAGFGSANEFFTTGHADLSQVAQSGIVVALA